VDATSEPTQLPPTIRVGDLISPIHEAHDQPLDQLTDTVRPLTTSARSPTT